VSRNWLYFAEDILQAIDAIERFPQLKEVLHQILAEHNRTE